jgi:hypothetical protein
MKHIKPFVAGATFMLMFGIIDNLFLILGMAWLEKLLPTIDPIVNGGIGNTISDAVGVIAGASISSLIARWLQIKEDDTTFTQQLIGIIIGCLLPIVGYLIYMYL